MSAGRRGRSFWRTLSVLTTWWNELCDFLRADSPVRDRSVPAYDWRNWCALNWWTQTRRTLVIVISDDARLNSVVPDYGVEEEDFNSLRDQINEIAWARIYKPCHLISL